MKGCGSYFTGDFSVLTAPLILTCGRKNCMKQEGLTEVFFEECIAARSAIIFFVGEEE